MDRYSAIQSKQQHYIATMLNSRQYYQSGKKMKRNVSYPLRRTENETTFEDTDASICVRYEPPPPISSPARSNSSEEVKFSKKIFQRLSRKKIVRTRSEGYIPPSPLRTTNTGGSLKEINKSSSQRGLCRAYSGDIYFHPNQARNNGMISSAIMTDITVPSPSPLISESSSSSTSVKSTTSSLSQSSCATGNNLYNYLSRAVAQDANIMNDGNNNEKDDCGIERTIATTRNGDENDYNISLSSLHSSSNLSCPKLSYSFRQLLSTMSDDSMVIAEESEEFGEDDLKIHDELKEDCLLFHSEKLENDVSIIYDNNSTKRNVRRRAQKNRSNNEDRNKNHDNSIGTIVGNIDLSLMRRRNRNRNGNHRFNSILQRETERSIRRMSD